MKRALLNIIMGVGLGSAALFMTGCSEQAEKVEFLAFGDSGYHYDYQKAKLFKNPMTTKEAYLAAYKEKNAEKHFPLDRLPEPPLYFHDGIGGYIPQSGMSSVATAMKHYCAEQVCQFAVMLGDNIYPNGATLGGDGRDDTTRFRDMFTVPFGDLGKGQDDFSIYVTLGNHDWHTSREGAMAQVEFMENTRPFYMDGLFYSVKPPAGKGEVELFIIDTEMLLSTTTVYEAKLDENGHEVRNSELNEPDAWTKPTNEAERNMLQWFEKSLKNSTAKWKLVIAHHPIWSSAGKKFEQGKALAKLILPAMCKYADGFFVGHEHTLEVHADNCETALGQATEIPLPEIVSGTAAKLRPINPNFKAYQDRTYPQNEALWVKDMAYGFSHISLEGDVMTVTMITTPGDDSGTTVEAYTHRFKRRSHKSGK